MLNAEAFLKDHLDDLASVAEVLAGNLGNLLLCQNAEVNIQGDIVSGGYIQVPQSAKASGEMSGPAPAEPWQVLSAVDADRANLLLEHLQQQSQGTFPVSNWTQLTIDNVTGQMRDELKKVALSHGAALLGSQCSICGDWH